MAGKKKKARKTKKRKKKASKRSKRRTTPKWTAAKRASYKRAKRSLIHEFNRK